MYMKKSTLIISCFAGISMVALAGCGDSSSGTDAKGAADEASEKYFPDIKSGSCDFKKEDKVWKYTSTAEADGDVSVVARYYTYKKGGSIDSNVVVTTGEDVKMACKYADETVYDDDEAGSKISSTCKDDALYTIDVQEGIDPDLSRDEAFDEVMQTCKTLNKVKLDGKGDAGDTGKDDDGDTEDEGKVICDFDDDDLWIVQEDGDYGKYRYHEWHGDSVTVWWVKENGSIFGTNTTKQDKAQTLKDFKKKCTEYKDLNPKGGEKEEDGGSSSSAESSDGCIASFNGECLAWACSKEHKETCTDKERCEMGDKDYCEEEDDDGEDEEGDDVCSETNKKLCTSEELCEMGDKNYCDDDDGPATTTVTCDFAVTDNEWEVVINNDMSMIYEWTGTSYKVYNLSRDDTGSADNCQSTLESFGSTFDDASCEGSVFVGLTMMSEQEDCDESCREQAYEAVKQMSCSE